MQKIFRLITIIVALIMEGLGFYLLKQSDSNAVYTLLIHFPASVLITFGLDFFMEKKTNWKWAILFITGMMGIFGFAGMVFVVILKKLRKGKGEVFHLDIDEADEAGEINEEEESRFDETESRVEILEIESFADILHSEDRELRLGAITALQQLKDKTSISLLTDSLNSRFHEVRYYAVEALNQIAQEYMDKISVLTLMIEIKPDDAVIRETLADNYFKYAHKGIEEASIQGYYYKMALEQYNLLLKDNDKNIKILERAVIIMFNISFFKKCIETCEKILELEKENLIAIGYMADALLIRKNFPELKVLCREILSSADIPIAVKQSAEMWV